MGLEVVLCDQNPKCPGRDFADRFAAVSVVDTEEIRRVAMETRASGISSYACDPGALTAAIVSESIGLPTNPSAAVAIVSRKDLLRRFLRHHCFAVPEAAVCSDAVSFREALARIGLPCFVKPVDSSGSKGVSFVQDEDTAGEAFKKARQSSRCHQVIVETPIRRSGPQVAGDGFVQGRKLRFACFGDENFDLGANSFAPVGESFPSIHARNVILAVQRELSRFVEISGLSMGAINFDIVVDDSGKVFIIDLGARSGGNGIPELISAHSGIDLIECSILAALGERVETRFDRQAVSSGFCATYVVHSRMNGWFRAVNVDESIKPNIVKLTAFKEKLATRVRAFADSSDSLGYALLRFENEREMREAFLKLPNLIQADVQN
jgi:biotin carboxylase